MRGGYLRGLDGLRALAILGVLVWHTFGLVGFRGLGPLKLAVTCGWMGVDLFFALSGFLITTLILDEEARAGRFDLPRFYARRALRILPAFFAVLLLDLVALRPMTSVPSAHLPSLTALEWLSVPGFFSNYALAGRGDVGSAYLVFWSLCVEEHFYLAWPFVLRRLRASRARLGLALAVCALAPLLRLADRAVAFQGGSPMAAHFASHLRLDAILIGCAAALAFDALRAHPRARRAALVASVATVAALVVRGDLRLPPTLLGAGLGYSALALAGALLVAEVVATPEGRLTRALESPPLAALGRLSYGLYLIHLPMLDLAQAAVVRAWPVRSLARDFAVLALGLALSIAAALALHRLVEAPARRLKARFARPADAEPRERLAERARAQRSWAP